MWKNIIYSYTSWLDRLFYKPKPNPFKLIGFLKRLDLFIKRVSLDWAFSRSGHRLLTSGSNYSHPYPYRYFLNNMIIFC